MTRIRPIAVLALAAALAACRAEERDGSPPGEDGPVIVELNDPIDDAPSLEPVAGDTGLLAQPVGELPDHFGFVDETGAERSFAELRGKFVVLDFIFTECRGPCPPMAEQMAALQERIQGLDDVVLRSITVDPKDDTPEVLADYAEHVGADPAVWGFVRMPIGFVNELTREEFLVGDGGTPLAHTAKFLLIDKEGRGRAHYEPLRDPGWIDKVLADIERLRTESP